MLVKREGKITSLIAQYLKRLRLREGVYAVGAPGARWGKIQLGLQTSVGMPCPRFLDAFVHQLPFVSLGLLLSGNN